MNRMFKHQKIIFIVILLCVSATSLWAVDPECIVPNDTTIFQCSPTLVSLPVGCYDPDGDLVAGPDIVSVPAVGAIVGGNWEYTPSGNEVVNVTIRCEDSLGGICETEFIVTFIMNSPPDPPICSPDSSFLVCDISVPITIDGFVCTDPDNNLDSTIVIIGIDTLDLVNESITFNPIVGDNILKLICIDSCGERDSCETIITVTENSSPSINFDPTPTNDTLDIFLCAGDPFILSYEVIDNDNNIKIEALESGSPGTIDTALNQIQFVPVISQVYREIISVTDSCDVIDEDTIYINVTLNSPPDIIFGSDQVIDLCEPEQVCINYAVTDNDSLDIITETLLTGIPTAVIDTATNEICFTPDTSGNYSLQVEVTDNCGLNDIDEIVITVNFNEAPIADSTAPDDIFICQDTTITHKFNAVDSTFPSFTWASLTDGAVINAQGEMLLVVDTPGTYIVFAEVSDGCGLKDTVSHIFNISRNSSPIPNIYPIIDTFICEPIEICHQFEAVDPDTSTGDELSWTPLGLQDGTFDPVLAEWCFTPEESRAYQLSVMVEDLCGVNNVTEAVYNVTINSDPVCVVRDTLIYLADPLVYVEVPIGCSDEDYDNGIQSMPTIDLYGQVIEGHIVEDSGNYFWKYYVSDDDTLDIAVICTGSCGAFCVDTFNVIIVVNDPPNFTVKRNGTTSFTSDTAYIRPNQELNLWVTAEDEDNNLDTVFTINTDLSSLTPIGTFSWNEETNYTDSISGILTVQPSTAFVDSVFPVTFTARDNYNIFVDTTIYIKVLPVTNLEFAFEPDSSTHNDFLEERETILYYRSEDTYHPTDLITITPVSLPSGAIFQSIPGNPTHATITWKPGVCDYDQLGSLINISLRAVNDSGNVFISDGFELVDGGNKKPEIVADSQWVLTEEVPDTLIVTINDPDGNCVGAPLPIYNLLSFSENPNSGITPELIVSNDTAFIVWEPLDGDRGDYILTIEADDQLEAKDTAMVVISVLATSNKIPEFVSLTTDANLRVNNPDGSITLTNYESDQFYFELKFEDGNVLDTLDIVYDLDALINRNKTGWEWKVLSIDTNFTIGRFLWTPSDTDASNYSLLFYADDGEAVSDTVIVDLRIVDQGNTPPEIECESADYRVEENSTLSFGLWAVDIDSDDTLFKFTSLPRPPVWGNGNIVPFDVLSDSAVFTWTPDYCIAMDDSVRYEIIFTATDNDSLSDDTTINIWVIDGGNELAQLGIPSWDSISIGGNQTSIPLTITASDRDCDRIKFSGFETSLSNTIIAVIPDAVDSIFYNDTLVLNIFLSSSAEGVFYATLYIDSDHNGTDWELSDSLRLTFYIGDKVPPTGEFDPVIVSQCLDSPCNPVITRAEFNDIGSGIDSVYIFYRQGNKILPSQTKVFIPSIKATTLNVIDTIPDELFTIYGLEIIYQAFDGANPPNSSYDTVQLSYDYHFDYSPTNAPYGRVTDFVPPTLRTLFYNDFTEGPAVLDKWTLFSIPGNVDSVYLRIDSLFRFDLTNYAYNETSYGWRVYERSLWETGESNGKYELMSLDEPLEHDQAYLYRRLDNTSVNESNERLYIPHGKVRSLNEISFDYLLNYNNKQVWRFIGNPFPFPIKLDSLFGPSSMYKSGINSIYAWNWEIQSWIRLPATGQDLEFNILQPYSGFICWPFDPGNAHLIINPDWVFDPTVNIQPAKNANFEKDFAIRMDISASGLTDNLEFGFLNDASEFAGWEDYYKFTSDFENRFIKFGINNFDWLCNAGIYSGDFRPYPAEGDIWPLIIYSSGVNDGSEVIFNWKIEDQYSNYYEIWLIDKYTEKHINMRGESSYLFKQISAIEDQRFEIITGTEYFFENYLNHSSETVPLSFQLYQNYPNPFNPVTTIQFDLPNSGDISLSIFNVLGQEVRRVFDGVMIKGEHTLEWDGMDNKGNPVASGTYFYRLQTNQQTQTRKMILIR